MIHVSGVYTNLNYSLMKTYIVYYGTFFVAHKLPIALKGYIVITSPQTTLPADSKLMCLECSGLLKSSCACEVGTHHLPAMPVRVAGLRRELMQLERNVRSTFYITHKSPL